MVKNKKWVLVGELSLIDNKLCDYYNITFSDNLIEIINKIRETEKLKFSSVIDADDIEPVLVSFNNNFTYFNIYVFGDEDEIVNVMSSDLQ